MIETQIFSNFKAFKEEIDKVDCRIAFVQSRAAALTIADGRRAAIREGLKALEDPLPAMFNEKKGWIAIQWDDKNAAKKKGVAEAAAWVRGLGSSAKELRAQQEIAHRLIEGPTVANTPISTPYIIKPGKRLVRGQRIIGVPLKIDDNGNIKGTRKGPYYKTIEDMLKNPKYKGQFFEVRVGERVVNRNKILPPGLYQRVLYRKRKSDYKKNPATGKRRGPYNPTGRPKYTADFLITILQYYPLRKYKGDWDFKPPAYKFMRERYPAHFLRMLDKEFDRGQLDINQRGRLEPFR